MTPADARATLVRERRALREANRTLQRKPGMGSARALSLVLWLMLLGSVGGWVWFAMGGC